MNLIETLVDSVINSMLQKSFFPQSEYPMVSLRKWLLSISILWAMGVVVMLIYALINYLKLYSRIRTAIRSQGNIFSSEFLDTPFVFGIIHPRIYLPSGLPQEICVPVIAHEQAHLKRRDHIWKVVGYGLLAVYWFHPLCWVAYSLFCKDMELACDEKVIRDYDIHQKKVYSEALLTCSIHKHTIAIRPLAFGEVGLKERIHSVLHYKKPAFWVIGAAVVVYAAAVICFMTDPIEMGTNIFIPSTVWNDGKNPEQNPELKPVHIASENDDEETIVSGNENNFPDKDSSIASAEAAVWEWAKAFVNRDGNSIAAIASDNVIRDLLSRNFITGSDGQYSFGEFDSWPQDITLDVSIKSMDSDHASLRYYAWSPNQMVTVWQENLTLQLQNENYVITSEELILFQNITTRESYCQAYGYDDSLNNTRMDYLSHGTGVTLNQMAYQSYDSSYQDLFEPESAAVKLLHLSEDTTQVALERYWEENGVVGLEITFLDDGMSIYMNMVQPYGKDGIWIPQDYKVDVIYRLSNMDWSEIKSRRLTRDTPDFFDIVLIDQLPEKHIAIYGYNDEQCQMEGVAIELNGNMNYFDWVYTSPRSLIPDCYWNEENKQLQMALYVYTGSGLAAQELHVLQQSDNNTLQDNTFGWNDYTNLLYDRIQFAYNEETGRLTLYDNQSQTELTEIELAENDIEYLELGCISNFVLGEKLVFYVETGYYPRDSVMVEYENMPILEIEILMEQTENGIRFDFGEMKVADT